MAALTPEQLTRALPELGGTVRLTGLAARVEVWRDPDGLPHIQAASVGDAFLAQGFVHAQDRLWHLEYDRRRAYGRWAEYAGPAALPEDRQMRRFRLLASARADYAALNAETRAMLDAYAAGINAFLRTARGLPVEFQLLGARPEPWEPWDSLAVFKVRHVLMGTWQTKAWRARLLRHLGPARTAYLCPGTQPNPMLIVPPGVDYRGPAWDGLKELAEGEAALAHLPEWESGSNNWAVAGTRTASGKPLLAGDPHRPIDVPNVYYQNHLACPEFDAVGLSFPGVPGFPHFGHNAAVAWCVTHTAADYQDLYVERFDPADPRRYEFRGQWREADVARETIRARGAADETLEVTVTHHGPIVLGDPRRGYALAFKYTATAAPNPTLESLLPTLRARSAAELELAMRPWVDPVNNLVFADVHGAIGYRTRGQVPIRPMANAWLPVPGWDGAHEWQGTIPFEEMPVVRNPAVGFVATANSRVTGADYPHYLGMDYAPDFRTRRVVHRLRGLERATVGDMAAIHGDRVSIPARDFVELLRPVPASDESSRRAVQLLADWDGVMTRDSAAPTIYAAVRERLLKDVMTPLLGPLAAEAFAGAPRGAVAHMARFRARLTELIRADDRTLLPAGSDWPTALARALAGAVGELGRTLGPDPGAWQWGRVHRTQPRHPLSAAFPEAAAILDPPSVPMGGDGDTVQSAGFIAAAGYGITLASVARYAFDLADWDRSGWVVPLGASGHPGSPHYADQAGPWSDVRLLPMRYGWAGIRAEARAHQVLDP
jgi:penicillin amidase